MKVVINRRFGGFALSKQALAFMCERGNAIAIEWRDDPDLERFTRGDNIFLRVPRNDPDLVAAVESLGDAASGHLAALKLVEIPDGIEWEVDDYDGMERVVEAHRSWP